MKIFPTVYTTNNFCAKILNEYILEEINGIFKKKGDKFILENLFY